MDMWTTTQYITAAFGALIFISTMIGIFMSCNSSSISDEFRIEQDIWDEMRYADPSWGIHYSECCDDDFYFLGEDQY